MGYRSDVLLGVVFPSDKELCSILSRHMQMMDTTEDEENSSYTLFLPFREYETISSYLNTTHKET